MDLPSYLNYKNNTLYYQNTNLLDLIKQEGECLEVTIPDIIDNQIKQLKNVFNQAIKDNNYSGKYEYFYATKANYERIIIEKVLNNTKYLETSSKNDIAIIEYLYHHQKINQDSKIICNGFKNKEYFDKIIKLIKEGLQVTPIVENSYELDYLVNLNIPLNIGIRVNVDNEYNQIFQTNDCSRFGFSHDDLLKSIPIIQNSKLKLTIFHFHLNHRISNINKYIQVLDLVIQKKYLPLIKKINSLNYFDIGGGIPPINNKTFNYYELVDKIIKTLKKHCLKNNISAPNIISECGAYTVADSRFNIYKVQLQKRIKDNKYWYILNNSIVTTIPDSWIINKNYVVLPINLTNNKKRLVRLSSLTCDNEDRYYHQENKDYLSLPVIKDNEELFIGFFKTGAYEEHLSGKNTIHHCLIEEPKKILISDNKIILLKDTQTNQEILDILGYH